MNFERGVKQRNGGALKMVSLKI